MRRLVWIAGVVVLLLGAGLILAGCSTQLKWFGAGGVDCEWDEINYKVHNAQQLSPAAGNDDLHRQAEESMRRAEEEQKQLDFGACSENDLANRTCH